MAPAPITATRSGTSSRDSNSSLVTTSVPSTSKPGMVRGVDPVASTMWSAAATVDPLGPSTVTTWSAPRRPVPS